MCEEVRQPATQVPKAMCGALLMSMACGFVFLVPLMFVLPEIADVVATGQPLPAILSSAIGNQGGAFALTVPIIVLGILCGTSCTTAASRCTWAFSRDGAIPGSKWWKQVNTKLDVPLNAMMLSMVIQIVLGCIYFGSTAAFNAFIGSAVIFLTFAYASPVLASLLTGRKCLKMGAYDFKGFGYFCNVVTIGKSIPYSLPPCPSALTPLLSMVSLHHTSVLFPSRRSSDSRDHELRLCRVRLRCCMLSCLVLYLGTQELSWTAGQGGRGGQAPKLYHRDPVLNLR